MTNLTLASSGISVALSTSPVATNEISSQQAQPKSNKITTHVKRLNDTHYKECVEKRGLDPEWIRVNCESFNKKQASERLGYAAESEGIWLEGANGFGQFRPNKAWKSKEEKASKKQAPKYRCATEEEIDAMLPKHPTNPQYWEDLVELAKLCWVIDGKACLVITEGMFKAIMGCQHGIPTIALAGVWQGFTKKDWAGRKHLVETLYRLAGTGKFGFIIIFDADANTNQNIVAATRELAHGLSKAKVPVYIGTGLWDESEGKGMDDFIKKCGIDRFKREVMGKVVDLATWEKQFKSEDKKLGRVRDLVFAFDLSEKYRPTLAWNMEAKRWYQYDKHNKGVWGQTFEESVTKLVIQEVRTQGLDVNGAFVHAVVKLLKSELSVERWEVTPGFICLQDCVVNTKTLDALPHDPGYRFLSSLPYNWSSRSKGCEPIINWLLETCKGNADWVQVIRGAINATVTSRGNQYQRYIELQGPGATGKSTLLGLVKRLIGKDAYHETSFEKIEKDKFATAPLYAKKAAFISDSERYAGELSNFKKGTGNDELANERKWENAEQGFIFDGVFWVACNGPVQSQEYYSNAISRRRVSLLFDKVVPLHLQRELMPEFIPYMAGFLYWALSMSNEDVYAYFKNTNKTVPSLANYGKEVLLATNPLANWADEAIIYREDFVASIGRKDNDADKFLYPNYCQWAHGMGQTPLSQVKFSAALLNLLRNELHLDVAKPTRNKAYGTHFKNISLRMSGHNDPLLISHSMEEKQECRVECKVSEESVRSRSKVGVELVQGNKNAESIDLTGLQSNSVELGAKLTSSQPINNEIHHDQLVGGKNSKGEKSNPPPEPCTSTPPKSLEPLHNNNSTEKSNVTPTLHQEGGKVTPNLAPAPTPSSSEPLENKDGVELSSSNTNPAPITNRHQEAREQGALSRGEGSISPLPPAHFPPASSGHQVKEGDIITAKLLPTDAAPRQAKVTDVQEAGVWARTKGCEFLVKWENIQTVNSQPTKKWWEQRLDD